MTFDLKSGAHYFPCVRQPSYQFWCFWDYSFSIYGLIIYLPDEPRDIETLTFDLGVCLWYGSSYSIWIPSFKFICLSVWKIWCTSGLSISRLGDLDLLPLTLELVRIIARRMDNIPINYRPTPIRRITWPCDLDLWPWRSRRLSVMRIFVFRLCIKFEVCRPSVRKILLIYCVSINRPDDLVLLTSKSVHELLVWR